MNGAQYRARVAKDMGETGKAGLQAEVQAICDRLGLFCYHVPDSRRLKGQGGFPDCWIVNLRTGRVVYRELKSQSGQQSRDQKIMAYALIMGGHDYALWRPADLMDGSIGAELLALAGKRAAPGACYGPGCDHASHHLRFNQDAAHGSGDYEQVPE